jgi:hypothetical protein
MDQRPKGKTKIHETTRRKYRQNNSEHQYWQDVLDKTPKTQATKAKLD